MDRETERQPQHDLDLSLQNEEATEWQLIVWNDEVNTFDWVIKSLVDICHHTMEQAEQCALFVHFKGKYAVKRGDFDTLRPMCEALLDRGITATVEEMANV